MLMPFPRCVTHMDLAGGRCANCVWAASHHKDDGLPDCEFAEATRALKLGKTHPLSEWVLTTPEQTKFSETFMPSTSVFKGPGNRSDLMVDQAWDWMAKAQRDRFEILKGQGAKNAPADIGAMDIDQP